MTAPARQEPGFFCGPRVASLTHLTKSITLPSPENIGLLMPFGYPNAQFFRSISQLSVVYGSVPMVSPLPSGYMAMEIAIVNR